MQKILLLGDYSGNNTGHSALLLSIIKELRSVAECGFLIPTLKPNLLKRVLAGIENIEIISVAPWRISLKFLGIPAFMAIKNADCILLTDNLFYDSGLFNPFKNNLIALLFIVYYAKALSKPVVYYNSAVGPVNTKIGRWCIRWIINKIDLITLRDVQSKEILDRIIDGISPAIEADSAFNLIEYMDPSDLRLEQQDSIGINMSYHFVDSAIKQGNGNVTKEMVLRGIAENIRYFIETTSYEVILFITHPRDIKITKTVAEYINKDEKVHISDCAEHSLQTVFKLISRLNCFIGTRYHEMVMSMGLDIPVIAIDCGEKIQPLLESLELNKLVIQPLQAGNAAFREKLPMLVDFACGIKGNFKERLADTRMKASRSKTILIEKGYIN